MTGLDGFAFDSATGTGDLSQSTTDGGQAALSSIIKVNGVTITSDSNTVTDAIQGVTLNLTKVSSSATTLTVSQDKTTALSTALAAIVKAYNDFNTSVVTLGKYDATTKTGGPLLGNSTLRSTSYSVRSAFQSSSVLTGGQSKRLSDIGLEFQKDGSIVFNSAKFATAANNNYDATALLAATFGTSTKSLTTNMLGTKGSITAATDGLKTSISGIDKQREALQLRLTQVETRYRRQFTALDSLVASLNSTSTYLTQQLANLSKINSSSN
jgi:flagellar hook-associated protein 2